MKLPVNLWWISIGLAIVGIIDSAYLTWVRFSSASILCTGFGGCDVVQQSSYAEIAGIPVALVGLGGYLGVLALLLVERGRGALATNAPYAVFGLTLIGTLYSIYLTYIEVFVLYAVCPYCVISAVVMLLLLIVAGYRLARPTSLEST